MKGDYHYFVAIGPAMLPDIESMPINGCVTGQNCTAVEILVSHEQEEKEIEGKTQSDSPSVG